MSHTMEHFSVRLAEAEASGPIRFCNPTSRRLSITRSAPESQAEATTESAFGAQHVWRSRDNRKGRHALALTPEAAKSLTFLHPTNTLRATLRGVGKMFSQFPIWDVSYDVATIFTLGKLSLQC